MRLYLLHSGSVKDNTTRNYPRDSKMKQGSLGTRAIMPSSQEESKLFNLILLLSFLSQEAIFSDS